METHINVYVCTHVDINDDDLRTLPAFLHGGKEKTLNSEKSHAENLTLSGKRTTSKLSSVIYCLSRVEVDTVRPRDRRITTKSACPCTRVLFRKVLVEKGRAAEVNS